MTGKIEPLARDRVPQPEHMYDKKSAWRPNPSRPQHGVHGPLVSQESRVFVGRHDEQHAVLMAYESDFLWAHESNILTSQVGTN